MSKKHISTRDFSQEHVQRIGNFRHSIFGVTRPANPRWLPKFKSICFLPHLETSRVSPCTTLDGRTCALSYSLVRKMSHLGLMEPKNFQSEKMGLVPALSSMQKVSNSFCEGGWIGPSQSRPLRSKYIDESWRRKPSCAVFRMPLTSRRGELKKNDGILKASNGVTIPRRNPRVFQPTTALLQRLLKFFMRGVKVPLRK